MPMFRKNPVIVEAVQVTPQGFKAALAFAVARASAEPMFFENEPAIKLYAGQGEGAPIAQNGDWLIAEGNNELLVVSDADFEEEYHPIRGPKTVRDKVAELDVNIEIAPPLANLESPRGRKK